MLTTSYAPIQWEIDVCEKSVFITKDPVHLCPEFVNILRMLTSLFLVSSHWQSNFFND